jgi:putative membrane protein
MKKIAFNVLLAASLFTAVACNENKNEDSTEMAEEQNEAKFDERMEDDTEFAVAAADGGMLEVQLGELAQKNGMSSVVKDFGKMMADEHGKANDELKSMAQAKNITLPTSLSSDNQDTYDDLAKKTGKEFDQAYADLMVKDHKKDIEEFKEKAEDGKNADLKAWAAGKVPTLEMHLQKAQAMQDAVK